MFLRLFSHYLLSFSLPLSLARALSLSFSHSHPNCRPSNLNSPRSSSASALISVAYLVPLIASKCMSAHACAHLTACTILACINQYIQWSVYASWVGEADEKGNGKHAGAGEGVLSALSLSQGSSKALLRLFSLSLKALVTQRCLLQNVFSLASLLLFLSGFRTSLTMSLYFLHAPPKRCPPQTSKALLSLS